MGSHGQVPERVRAIADGREVTIVWRNEIGGTTFSIGDGAEFVKWSPEHPEVDTAREAERMRWAASFVPVPEVIEHGAEDGAEWMHTRGLPGASVVHRLGRHGAKSAARALGEALRAWHDAIPVSGCRWRWGLEERLAGLARAADLLARAPEIDRAVVCHGDACNPNFLFDDGLHLVGYVDVGCLGIADRWADIAPATMSLGWNFPGIDGLEDAFFGGYGIPVDETRLAFYRDVWNAE